MLIQWYAGRMGPTGSTTGRRDRAGELERGKQRYNAAATAALLLSLLSFVHEGRTEEEKENEKGTRKQLGREEQEGEGVGTPYSSTAVPENKWMTNEYR